MEQMIRVAGNHQGPIRSNLAYEVRVIRLLVGWKSADRIRAVGLLEQFHHGGACRFHHMIKKYVLFQLHVYSLSF